MRDFSWEIRVGAGLLAALLSSLVAGAQPVPAPAGQADQAAPAADPIAELLSRITEPQPPQAAPVVIGLTLDESPERTSFAVEISDPVDVQMFTLTDPNRVVIDMPEVLWRLTDGGRPSGQGAIKSYRYGLFRAGNSRFVIDLNAPVRAAAPRLLPPAGGYAFRLVIDLLPVSPEEFIANAGWPEALRATLGPPPAPALPPVAGGTAQRVVVVDAGHGGIDPGTHGMNGLQEKDVVLAVARRLRDVLEATGRYRVYLTRDTDVFIPLRGRVDIARAARADLFVSLHADSNDHREIRGASVYTLSEDASDREAASLAEKENMSDVIAGVDLSGDNSPVASILIDLAQRDTMNRSVRFAETVLTNLPAATLVRPTTPHRSAGFAVLKAPDVPAVLIELGYLTNPLDEREMGTEAWRTQVAGSIKAAIDRHFGLDQPPGSLQASVP